MSNEPIPAAPRETLPDPLPTEPFALFWSWFQEAQAARRTPNPDAMVLATASADGKPAARVVLCKAIDPAAGTLTFYTNYRSPKAADLEANPRAAAVFHWDHMARQARFEGTVVRVSEGESDAYFATRPTLSQLGAWASEQSRPVSARWKLATRLAEMGAKFGLGADWQRAPAGVRIPRPAHWGGYRIRADRVELWVGGEGRIHDRAAWSRGGGMSGAGDTGTSVWQVERLQP